MKIQQVEEHLASHHGVISRREARLLGMTESQVTKILSTASSPHHRPMALPPSRSMAARSASAPSP